MTTPLIIPMAPASPGAPEGTVTNDGWLPNVDLAQIRAGYRIRAEVTADRLQTAVIGAMLSVRTDLRDWIAARRTEGHASLADVPADRIVGASVLVLAYHRAISAYTRAELIEGYRDTDLTGRGERKVEELDPSVDELRRDALHAIRDILGVGRTSVELI